MNKKSPFLKESLKIVLLTILMVNAVAVVSEWGRAALAYTMNYDKRSVNIFGFYNFSSSEKSAVFDRILSEHDGDYEKSKLSNAWQETENRYNGDQGLLTLVDLGIVLCLSILFYLLYLRRLKRKKQELSWLYLIGAFAFFKYILLTAFYAAFRFIPCEYARGLFYLNLPIKNAAIVLLVILLTTGLFIFTKVPRDKKIPLLLFAPIGACIGGFIWWKYLCSFLLQ